MTAGRTGCGRPPTRTAGAAWPAGGRPADRARGSRSWGSSTPRHPCSGLLRCVASAGLDVPEHTGNPVGGGTPPARLSGLDRPAWYPVGDGEGGRARLEPLLQVLTRAVRRGGVFVVGMTLLVDGAAMLVLPGPGIAVILLGLVVLSAEFKWAQQALAWVRERFTDLKEQAQARLPGGNRQPPGGNRQPPGGPPTRDRPDQAA